jgi:hypothetical protein
MYSVLKLGITIPCKNFKAISVLLRETAQDYCKPNGWKSQFQAT